jgi:hypothetical protein
MQNLLDTSRLVGKEETEASQICENSGHKMRVMSKDGESYLVTCDYRTDRINVNVIDGKISSISGIG